MLTALLFETIANVFFDGQLFKQANAVSFFVVWYSFLYSFLYFISKKLSTHVSVIIFAVIGTLAEIFIFHRLNIIVDPIVYSLMAFIPISLYKKSGKVNL